MQELVYRHVMCKQNSLGKAHGKSLLLVTKVVIAVLKGGGWILSFASVMTLP